MNDPKDIPIDVLSPELAAAAKRVEAALENAHKLGDSAHEYAHQVYELSKTCLMAHSIRAVQKHLEDSGKGRHWISLTPTKGGYLPRRAFAMIRPQETDIIVNTTVGLEHQRRGIAHELAHLLFVKLHNSHPPSLGRVETVTEEACITFEKDLCKNHHEFYSKQENLNNLRFHSLDK